MKQKMERATKKKKGIEYEILYLISKPMLAQGTPVSWAGLRQLFLRQSEGFGLDTESPRDVLWHFPRAVDIVAEAAGREGKRRICARYPLIFTFSLCHLRK